MNQQWVRMKRFQGPIKSWIYLLIVCEDVPSCFVDSVPWSGLLWEGSARTLGLTQGFSGSWRRETRTGFQTHVIHLQMQYLAPSPVRPSAMFWDFEDSYRIFKSFKLVLLLWIMIISFLVWGKLAARRTLLYFQFCPKCYSTLFSRFISTLHLFLVKPTTFPPDNISWKTQFGQLLRNVFIFVTKLLPCHPSPKSRYCPFYNLSQSVSSLLCFMDTLYPARWLLPICAETLSNKALITHWRYMSKSTLANQSQA